MTEDHTYNKITEDHIYDEINKRYRIVNDK